MTDQITYTGSNNATHPWTASKKPTIRQGYDTYVEFVGIEPTDLASVPLVIQALDNQWIPRSLLQHVLHHGKVPPALQKQCEKQVRDEYIRALIHGQQVVINRAFLHNNPLISRDYTRDGQEREAFKTLLEDGVIVPFLLGEQAPDDAPHSGPGTMVSYDVEKKRHSQWQRLCQEVRMHCVRLSWDDQKNWELARQHLSECFNRFVASAAISEILPLPIREFTRMLRENEITDGFTLAAYARAQLCGLL